MSRLSLPQNYILDEGSVYQDMQDDGNWSGSPVVNTDQYKNGTQSLKFTKTGGTIIPYKTISEVFTTTRFSFWVYFHTDPLTTLSTLTFLISSNPWSSYFSYEVGSANLTIGWNLISAHRSEFTAHGSEAWSNTMTRIGLNMTTIAGQTCTMSIGGINTGIEQTPRILITFDDGYSQVISADCFTYMNDLGISGTAYINSSTIGTTGRMTVANLHTLYDAGWAVANHCSVHTDLRTITQSEAEELITVGAEYLSDLGFSRSCNHLAYPYGTYNQTVLAAAENAGVLTGRLAGDISYTPFMGADKLHLAADYVLGGTESLATIKKHVDDAFAGGKTLILVFHKIVESVGTVEEWAIADFQALIDYIIARRIPCVTIDEWYEGLTNPRYRSLPLSR